MAGIVTYLGRVKEGNYHTQVTHPTLKHLPTSPILSSSGSAIHLHVPYFGYPGWENGAG